MKKIAIAAGLVIALAGLPLLADDAPTCDDYKQFATVIRAATDYISSTKGDFSDNEELSDDMDELVEVLGKVAKAEDDAGFSSAVANMTKIWSKKTWSGDDVTAFKQAFDAAAVAIERVAKKHC